MSRFMKVTSRMLTASDSIPVGMPLRLDLTMLLVACSICVLTVRFAYTEKTAFYSDVMLSTFLSVVSLCSLYSNMHLLAKLLLCVRPLLRVFQRYPIGM